MDLPKGRAVPATFKYFSFLSRPEFIDTICGAGESLRANLNTHRVQLMELVDKVKELDPASVDDASFKQTMTEVKGQLTAAKLLRAQGKAVLRELVTWT